MRVIGITPINNDLKEEKSMKFLQKLGKALMLPVAVLPICGILMGIGYMLCPEAMQGGDIQGAADMIGLFLVKAGGALVKSKFVCKFIFQLCGFIYATFIFKRFD